ncbi:MAG: adenylosuccinate lyase [Syntrophales bacterium]|nr:adenylosuccinate lyase [Syntrophales bacterium]
MIPRYTRPVMEKIWSTENRYQKWLEIEILACEAMAEIGQIPAEAAKNIRERAKVDIGRVEELEKITHHDVAAFVAAVAETVGGDGRFIHLGLTSSDILDTALAVLLKDAADVLIEDIEKLLIVLKEKAFQYKNTVMIGRTHGIHAEPITFGLKLALWYEEMKRNKSRLVRAREVISYGKIAGAVGTYSFVDPRVEAYVCEKLGLKPEPVATQIVQRDRHGEFFATLAIIASSLDRYAQEIRLLQRTEVREVEEYFSPGQKGSSAMPHKRNPVLSENISGLARLVRSYAVAALEDIPLWHERDISHSSVERVIAPDATTALDFMLHRFTGIVERLLVYPDRMQYNLNLTRGLIFSQNVLLKLIDAGMSRDMAYEVVQRNAMKCWETGTSFEDLILQDAEVMAKVAPSSLKEAFSLEPFLKQVDFIFRRVFSSEGDGC